VGRSIKISILLSLFCFFTANDFGAKSLEGYKSDQREVTDTLIPNAKLMGFFDKSTATDATEMKEGAEGKEQEAVKAASNAFAASWGKIEGFIKEIVGADYYGDPSKKLGGILNSISKAKSKGDLDAAKKELNEKISEINKELPSVKYYATRAIYLSLLVFQKTLKQKVETLEAEERPKEEEAEVAVTEKEQVEQKIKEFQIRLEKQKTDFLSKAAPLGQTLQKMGTNFSVVSGFIKSMSLAAQDPERIGDVKKALQDFGEEIKKLPANVEVPSDLTAAISAIETTLGAIETQQAELIKLVGGKEPVLPYLYVSKGRSEFGFRKVFEQKAVSPVLVELSGEKITYFSPNMFDHIYGEAKEMFDKIYELAESNLDDGKKLLIAILKAYDYFIGWKESVDVEDDKAISYGTAQKEGRLPEQYKESAIKKLKKDDFIALLKETVNRFYEDKIRVTKENLKFDWLK